MKFQMNVQAKCDIVIKFTNKIQHSRVFMSLRLSVNV